MVHKYTPDQIRFIAEKVKGRSNKELTEMFNAHFGLDLKVTQIKGAKKNRGLTSGLDGRFVKGQESWCKGMKGLNTGGKKGWFKKGDIPHNHKPIGSERVDTDGYVMIKVAEPSVWRFKSRVVWEEAYGEVPDGYVVMFGDGNKLNVDIENLMLVSRSQLAILNQHDLIQSHVDATKSAVVLADYIKVVSDAKDRVQH